MKIVEHSSNSQIIQSPSIPNSILSTPIMKLSLIFLFGFVASIYANNVQCPGATVYAKHGSNCGSSCTGSLNSPYPNIQAALNALGSQGTVLLLSSGGPFNTPQDRNINIQNGFFCIRGAQPGVFLDCQNSQQRAFHIQQATVQLSDFIIQNCGSNSLDGGAIQFFRTNAQLEDMVFFNNHGNNGGAIDASESSLSVQQSSLINNIASNSGGAVHFFRTNIDFNNVFFQGNKDHNNQPNNLECQQGSATAVNANLSAGTDRCDQCNIRAGPVSLCPV